MPGHGGRPELLASAGDDGTVRIWDPETGTCLLTVPTHYPAQATAWVAESLAIGLGAGILVIEPNVPFDQDLLPRHTAAKPFPTSQAFTTTEGGRWPAPGGGRDDLQRGSHRHLPGASRGPPGHVPATSLNTLSFGLVGLGRQKNTLAAIEEAVTIRRGLAARWPDAYHYQLEQSLRVVAWVQHGESDASPRDSKDVITVRYPIFRRGIIFGRPGRHHSPGATSAWQVRPPRVARRELAPPRSSWPYLATVEAAQ